MGEMKIGDQAVMLSFKYKENGHLTEQGMGLDLVHAVSTVHHILATYKIVSSEYRVWEKVGENPLKTKDIRRGTDIRDLLMDTLF